MFHLKISQNQYFFFHFKNIKLALQRSETYATSISFVRRRVTLDLLRTCVMSLRGDRGSKRDGPIQDLKYGL